MTVQYLHVFISIYLFTFALVDSPKADALLRPIKGVSDTSRQTLYGDDAGSAATKQFYEFYSNAKYLPSEVVPTGNHLYGAWFHLVHKQS